MRLNGVNVLVVISLVLKESVIRCMCLWRYCIHLYSRRSEASSEYDECEFWIWFSSAQNWILEINKIFIATFWPIPRTTNYYLGDRSLFEWAAEIEEHLAFVEHYWWARYWCCHSQWTTPLYDHRNWFPNKRRDTSDRTTWRGSILASWESRNNEMRAFRWWTTQLTPVWRHRPRDTSSQRTR